MFAAYLDHIDQNIKYTHVQKQVSKIDFHLHRGCEIYFLLKGDVKYFVEKTIYPLQFGDLIITNEHEIHKPAFSSDALYERIVIEFNPSMAMLFQTAGFDPLECFYNRANGEQNKMSLTQKEIAALESLFMKYEYLLKNPSGGAELLKFSCFMEILVLINQLFLNQKHSDTGINMHQKLSPILDYIEQNLDQNLSLDQLEKEFYINKYYLIKLFKKYTGSTIHEYIIYKRISLAKKYLSQGSNVTEACMKSGFNDYSSFLRMFKKRIGVTPREYLKSTESTIS
ncbi:MULTISPECIES: AraC family transcriptional regulator [Paenibacillus]|uniref:AraC family transcriptional regulator n=1 Tax=Paenibacillus radicis (ex Xue et al. 2023) TaxID=2972489 RepID=A0ABT1YEM9_9BACL|nr:AraC family transcriptional regulator [Paenibacillus radicis (ex Xue et al. 2023)]MCR8631652.1 AraC family transcriptional regulator [Paenibacillus radicis (ex Xue et al. 2023)]